jgi:hypothetical protein
MLKRKRELAYRRASERFERCKYCVHKKWTPVLSCARGPQREVLYYAWRRELIGLDCSRRYNIQDNHVCDEYSHPAPIRGEQ